MKGMVARILVLTLLLASVLSRVPVRAAQAAAPETVSAAEIRRGTKGSAVKALQERLKQLGYYTISVDGDYGNGTKTAVSSFQARNGLAQTGIATVQTQQALYSDSAVAAPSLPALSISHVAWGDTTRVTVTNGMDIAVDAITVALFTYDKSGNIYSPQKLISFEEPSLAGSYTLGNTVIKSGADAQFPLDTLSLRDMNTAYASVGIVGFHTVDNRNYAYAPEQMTLRMSDGSVVFPTDESEPAVLSDAEIERAGAVKLGVASGTIYPWIAPFLLSHRGMYVCAVFEGSTFALAGFREGDVIISFDDLSATMGNVWEIVKLKMLDGETVTVHYWRSNKEYTAQIALDMDAVLVSNSAAENTDSIADHLARLAKLYEDGLLTREEYDAAKTKLLE